MTGEICRAEPEFGGLFLMSGKWSLGAEFAWKAWKLIMKPSGRWNRQNPWAVRSRQRLSYFQHIHKERNGDMTSYGGVNSSLCFRKHPLANFIINTIAISTFHLGLFTMCWIKHEVTLEADGLCQKQRLLMGQTVSSWADVMTSLFFPFFCKNQKIWKWHAVNLIITLGSLGHI